MNCPRASRCTARATCPASRPTPSRRGAGASCWTTRGARKATQPRSSAASNSGSSNEAPGVNRPIVRLYGLVAALFALLIAFTSRWTVFEASSLRHNKLNARALLEQQKIDRGPILAADGSVLARSIRGSEGIYTRTYPDGGL